jgi:hypothetical protein
MGKSLKEHRKPVKDYPFVEFTLRAYDTRPRDGEPGLTVFHTFPTEVSDGDGKEIGIVSGGTGYVVVCVWSDDGNGPTFLIPHDDIWFAIQKAMEAPNEKN